ncbi:hypothetical protein K439DRAFT_1547951 [Ramaria rubella]|nr:hypothetical protein K439DRAFT_1547951 [Ramaria rubella]
MLKAQSDWVATHSSATRWLIQSGEFERLLKSHEERVDALLQRFYTYTLRKIDDVQGILLQKIEEYRETLGKVLENDKLLLETTKNIKRDLNKQNETLQEIRNAVMEVLIQSRGSKEFQAVAEREFRPPKMHSWECVGIKQRYNIETRWQSSIAEELLEDGTYVEAWVHMMSPQLLNTEKRRAIAELRFERCAYLWRTISKARHPHLVQLQGAYHENSHFPFPFA